MDTIETLSRIVQTLDWYISDQESGYTPKHNIADLPANIHGGLYDLIDLDKSKEVALISTLTGFLYDSCDESPDTFLQTLKLLRKSLFKTLEFFKENGSQKA